MKKAALPLLQCTACRPGRPDLVLRATHVEGEEIVAGELTCEHGHRFPINDGIPDFVSGNEPVGEDSHVYDTMWRIQPEQFYPGRLGEYERKFQRFANLPGPLEPYFKDKLVLDAGC